ncbi:MAG TPA: uracil-DNA glycosylase [Methylotenera sp.]|nr:uracil-DNA glycosylase [Methylotenera sp.]
MAMTREDMLRELELLPAWKLREPIENPALAAKVELTMADSLSAPAAIEALPVIEDLPPSFDHVQKVAETIAESAIKPAEKEENTEPLKERIAAIKQMDWQALQDYVKDYHAGKAVFGNGDPNAEWLIISEAPNTEEELEGKPFVGDAGKLLDNMLAAIQLKRSENVFITNVLKCRLSENDYQHGEEAQECNPFLQRQVELIKPKLIIAMGESAAQSLLQSKNTIADFRGQLHTYNDVPVIVTYHPAYLLSNLADKAKAWEDLCFAKRTMQNL